MKKMTVVLVFLTLVIISGCTQSIGPMPTSQYPVVEDPMQMIENFAKQTVVAATQAQVDQLPPPYQTQFALENPGFVETQMAPGAELPYQTSTPPPTAPLPRLAFVVITQEGDMFGFDASSVQSLQEQVLTVDGLDYQGVSLFDILSSVNSVKFGISEIELQGEITFVLGFDQISNQTLSTTLLVENSLGSFDIISPTIPKENWVSKLKVIRIK